MIWPEEELESLRKKLNDININHLEESEKKKTMIKTLRL